MKPLLTTRDSPVDHDDPKQALRMRRYFMAAGTSLLSIGLMLASYLLGFLSRAAFYQSASLVLLAILVFYIVFRSGLNRRFSDPNLTVAQISASTLVTLFTMYASDGARAVFLVLLLMILLFGVLRLTKRVLLVYAACILAGYGAVIGLLWRFKPQSLNLPLELLLWLTLALTLPWFALMGGFVSGLRNILRKSNNTLQGVLLRVQESEASLAQAQHIAGLGSWTFDPVRRCATWSVETYRLFGIDPARPALIGEQFLRLVYPQDQGHYNELIRPALRDGRSFDDRFRIVRPTGEIRCLHILGQPVVNAEGHITLLRGTLMDITERKQAEDTRRGLEAQLRESQKMEAIGTLAAGIAHDFNNILGAILGNLALAREDMGAGHAALHSLEQINKSALRARMLVQQILAFGRRQPQELVNRPLRPIVQETLALMRASLPAGVSLEARLVDAPLHVLADATQVQQVLMNLCMNAWHALQGQAGRIVVGLEPTIGLPSSAGQGPAGSPPGEYAHLWVRDSGSGMDLATRARIFEPFFTTKPVGQGTGLGLSVVHGIVAAHQGAITVDSALGQGSTFHMYFPLLDSQDPAAASGWGALPHLQRQGQGQHVLYLDDDEVMVLLVERLLRRLGYRVSCYQDPREAVAAVRSQSQTFDLVVSDFNMPEFSGLDVARELTAIRPDLPVVISSGFLTEEQRAKLLRAGVRDVIQKENTLEDLGPLVNRFILRARSQIT